MTNGMTKEQRTQSLIEKAVGRVVALDGIEVTVKTPRLVLMPKVRALFTKYVTRGEEIAKAVDGHATLVDMLKVILEVVPDAFADFLPIVNECCDVDVQQLAHHHAAAIIDAWLQELLGEGRSDPWKALMKTLTSSVPGAKMEKPTSLSTPMDPTVGMPGRPDEVAELMSAR